MKTLRNLFTALLLLVATVASAQLEVGGIYYNITSSTDKTVAVTSKPGGYTGSVVIPESITVSSLAWVSDNHADNSVGEKIFPFTVEAGCVLSFGWRVSSEGNFDWLTITLDGEQIVRSSGSENGVFSRTFESSGEHQLTFSYSKDGSSSNGDDAATVTMLRLSKGSFNEQAETVIYSVTGIGGEAFSGCSSLINVTIPNSVTSIGWSAFNGCSGLTNLTIGNSVTSIGGYAFNGCTSLKNLRFEDGKSTLSLGYNTYDSNGDGKGLFFDCPLDTLYLGRDLSYQNTESYYTGYSAFYNIKTLKSLTIGNSVTSIGDNMFSGCSSLTSLTIPDSVTSIGESAFSGCSSLTNVTIPNSVTSIGWSAFYHCSSLTNVTIPNSVTSIGWSAFSGCSSLTNLTIGNSVTNIGNYAFNGCTSLKNMRIEDGEGTLSLGYNTYGYNGDGKGLFFDCPLDTLYLGRDLSYDTGDYYGYNPFYNVKTLKSLTIGNGVTSIGDNMFFDCGELTSLTIGNSVTSIGYSAFKGCSSLASLTIGNSVTSIGGYAFNGCSSLTSLTIPDSVTSIGESAFSGCSSLTNVTIPNSVTSIDWSAFYGCSSLTNVTIPNSVTSIGWSAFSGCSSLTNLTIGNSVTSIGGYAFNGCSSITNVTIPNSVTSIGESVFGNCSGLANLTIGNSVTNIGDYAFNGCISLKNLRIEDGEGTLSLGCNTHGYNEDSKGLFSDCPLDTLYLGRDLSYNTDEYYGRTPFKNISTLASLTIGNRVTCIGDYAFYGCTGLTSVTIPNSITRIGYWVFENCNKLEMINVSDIAAWCNIDFESHGCNPLYFGKKLYINGELLTGLVIPNSVTEIKKYAFYNCKDITSVTIPNSVTSIGVSAFYHCDNIGKVNIDDIAAWCNVDFSAYSSNPLIFAKKLYLDGELVTELVIPDGVTEIKKYAFYNSKDFTSVQIPNSVASIGNNAFSGCSNLTDLTILNGVTSIGNNAFSGCSNLTDLTIPNSVKSIGDYAFSACSGITSVKLGNSITSVGDYAFCGMEGGDMNAVFDIAARTPATICSGSFSNNAVFAVPDSSLVAYRTAWSNHASRIFAATDAIVKVDVDAKNNSSGVLEEIGVDKVASVLKLTVEGSINSYDVIQFRDKMPLLRELDLTNATVVASDKAFYSGNSTGDNSLGNYAFYGLSNLNYIKLPKGLNCIGSYMFQGCSNLRSIEIPDSVTSIGYNAFNNCSKLVKATIGDGVRSIDSYAFYCCYGLTSVTIPNSVTRIGNDAFNNCYGLVSVTLPNGLEAIEGSTFSSCNGLKEIKLPPTIKRIESYAFNYCPSLEEIRIPSSVEYIGNYAFQSCYKLQRVYTYTVEPTSIQEETFSTFKSATLYVPSFSYWNYYWDDGWKRFLTLAEFNEPYEYFYVNNDYVLDEETGYIEGADGNAPDADINAGGGFIVEGEQGDNEEPNQSLGNVNVGSNGNGTSGTIIGDNNLHIDSLHIKINVNGGRWYFFAFPFDIKFKDISMQNGSEYVFRYYDGEERAKKGNGGWKDVNEDHLKAARGYIFQCSADDVLVLSIKDVKFKKEDKYNELAAHVSENLKDASWNFTGNPYLSYYDMSDMDYTAPVTVWDGYKYVAVRPGDDDYHFAPYEAFFVQKPDGKSAVGFDGKQQMTKNQSNSKKEKQSAARRARGINPDRLLINIVLDNGTSSDRTRIVFNEQQSLAYETACDASKFETKGIAQLYTVDGDKVRYAINERPVDNGRVALGYSVPADGLFTIDVERMDVEALLVDTKNGTVHDFADGAYTFSSEAGTFDERFEIKLKTTAGGATDIDEIEGENGKVKGDIYDLQGRKVKRTENGIYIIGGEKILK